MLAHMAGMLHDVKRNKKDHAVEGAAFSREVLRDFPLSEQEQADVCTGYGKAHSQALLGHGPAQILGTGLLIQPSGLFAGAG